MMDEFTIAKKLQAFKSVKPNENWVALNKANILAKEFEKTENRRAVASIQVQSQIQSVFSFLGNYFRNLRAARTYRFAPIYSSLAVVIIGCLGLSFASRDALPGETLYTVRQTQEKIQMAFILSPEQKTVAQLNQASTRLDELNAVSQQTAVNPSKKQAVLLETKKAVAQATKEITNANLSPEAQANLIGQIAVKIQAVEKNTNAAIMDKDEPSFESIYKFLAENEIKELESNIQNLTLKQKDLLTQAKDFFSVNKYSDALDVLCQIQPQKDEQESNQEANQIRPGKNDGNDGEGKSEEEGNGENDNPANPANPAPASINGSAEEVNENETN